MKLTPSKEEKTLEKLIRKSKNILLITHRGIDHDAISSLLLTYHILQKYYQKKFRMIVQENKENWPKFKSLKLPHINKIEIISEEDKLNLSEYELAIIVDTDHFDRSLVNYIGETKLAAIDHHDTVTEVEISALINEGRSSATEQVYVTFQKLLGNKLEMDGEMAVYIQVGIIADTGRFLYSKVTPETYELMSEATRVNKINQEMTWKSILHTDYESIEVLGETIKNMKKNGNLIYSYVSREFMEENKFTQQQIKSGVSDNFLSAISRYINGVEWSFVIYPKDGNRWKVGFRSIGGTVDVEKIAKELGGGGHKAASSTNINTNSVEEALDKVLRTISQVQNP